MPRGGGERGRLPSCGRAVTGPIVRFRKGMRVKIVARDFSESRTGTLERRLKDRRWLVRILYEDGPSRFLKFRFDRSELRALEQGG